MKISNNPKLDLTGHGIKSSPGGPSTPQSHMILTYLDTIMTTLLTTVVLVTNDMKETFKNETASHEMKQDVIIPIFVTFLCC